MLLHSQPRRRRCAPAAVRTPRPGRRTRAPSEAAVCASGGGGVAAAAGRAPAAAPWRCPSARAPSCWRAWRLAPRPSRPGRRPGRRRAGARPRRPRRRPRRCPRRPRCQPRAASRRARRRGARPPAAAAPRRWPAPAATSCRTRTATRRSPAPAGARSAWASGEGLSRALLLRAHRALGQAAHAASTGTDAPQHSSQPGPASRQAERGPLRHLESAQRRRQRLR